MSLIALRSCLNPEPALAAASSADIAFQPIVSTASLRAHGFEALARLPDDCGFASVHALMDAAADGGPLRSAERILLAKSIGKFGGFSGAGATRLFCNVDNRVFDDPEVEPSQLVAMAARAGLEPANICIELSERQPPKSIDSLRRLVDVFLRHNIRIAIDDFGRGFSGLDMLMQVNPHYVKIDRAFIDGVGQSPRKQAIVGKVAGLAHSLGLLVVAEGVETETDFRAARDLGCDLAQGYLIARPTVAVNALRIAYDAVVAADTARRGIAPGIAEMVADVKPLGLTDPLRVAIERFKSRTEPGLLPVVDDHGYVHGAIYEADIRYYMFGDYGPALLANRGLDQSLTRLVRRCPISEASIAVEALVDSYVVAAGNEGIVLTLDGRYVGFLGNHQLLRLAAARDVAAARDQNPLTLLPGNNSINRHLTEVLAGSQRRTIVVFDFDNFKAFNDTYGFAVGDRALLMFADMLVKARIAHDLFVGHIGGDDFVMSLPADGDAPVEIVARLAAKFRADVASLYSAEARAAGGIWALDRFGEWRFFPLLRASATLAEVPLARAHLDVAEVVRAIAEGKRNAKKAENGLARVALPTSPVDVQRAWIAAAAGGV